MTCPYTVHVQGPHDIILDVDGMDRARGTCSCGATTPWVSAQNVFDLDTYWPDASVTKDAVKFLVQTFTVEELRRIVKWCDLGHWIARLSDNTGPLTYAEVVMDKYAHASMDERRTFLSQVRGERPRRHREIDAAFGSIP